MCRGKKITLYIDEADKGNIDSLKNYIDHLLTIYDNISSVCMITATPRELFKTWKISIIDEIKTPECYIGIRDLRKHPFDYKSMETNQQYFFRLLQEKSIEFPKNGEVWFIPAESKQQSHDGMITDCLCNSLFDQGIVINGHEKKFIQKTKEKTVTELYEGKEEIGQWINSLMQKDTCRRENHRTLITGCLCLSRGVTLQSNYGYITHVIIGPRVARKNEAEKYQTCTRVCGNLRNFPNYSKYGPPILICSEKKFLDHVRIMENYVYEISEHKGTVMDKDISERIYSHERNKIKNKDIDVLEFTSIDDLQAECDYRGLHVKWNNERYSPRSDGFYYGYLRSETKIWSYEEILSNKLWGMTTINSENNTYHRIYPCYKDISNKNTLVWILVCRHCNEV